MKRLLVSLAGVLLFFAGFSQRQPINITGTISDAFSHGIRGASIRMLNTNKGTISDSKGSFTLVSVFPGSFTVEVSATGYATQIQSFLAGVNGERVNIILHPSTKTLDEVVVSAQKREELLQKIPVSITALSAHQVEEYRLWNSKDLTAIVPTMYAAEPGDKRNVLSIRGITTTSYDPAMATYIDGVNQFSLDTYIAHLFDVERIEILRGAQGTLYGRNSMSGVMNIITRQPGNKASGFLEITNGNRGLQRYSGGVRIPVIKDKLYFGIAGLYDRSKGFYTNEFNNSKFDKQHNFTGNYYLKYLPANKWALTLNVKHNDVRNKGTFPLVFGVDDALKNPFKVNQNAVSNLVDNIFNTSFSLDHNGRYFNFSSQTAYQSNYRFYQQPVDADFSPIDGISLINNYGKPWNNVQVVTQEFKFSSPASLKTDFKWTAGTYLFYQDNPTKQAIHFGEDFALVGGPDKNVSLINSTNATSKGIAFYAQGTYSVTDKLDLTGGLRYDHEKKGQSILGQYQQDPDPVPQFDFRSDTSASAAFHAVSPKISAGYKMGTQNLIFANYSKGYRAGGLTPLSSDPSQPALFPFKPEYSNNYELGIKNTFLNNRLLVNVTAFYTSVTDAQVPTLVLPDAVTITKNTGKLQSKGIELETHGLFNGFQFDYNLGYTDAKFKSLELAQNGANVDLKGKKQLFTPDITSMLAVQYGFLILKKQQLRIAIRGEWRYIGNQYFDLANTLNQPSYSLFNSVVEVSLPWLSIKFWGRNLNDKHYVSYAYDFGAVHLGDPKTYGITAAFRL